jgi:hypothetical protein
VHFVDFLFLLILIFNIMKKLLLLSKAVLLLCLLFGTSVFSQVGIGTVTPEASSVLDVFSTTQGMLFPRLTTAQKTAIATPANGLMVYDTDLNAICYYKTGAGWIEISSTSTRSNYKLIKSTDVLATVLAAEKAAGGGSKYLLDTNTLYEINGTINLDFPIELNNSYLVGQDSGEDKIIIGSGDLFVGTTGGAVKVLTLSATAGKVFNIAGGGTQTLIFRDAVVASSSNVGVIDNFALVFVSIVQYVGNTTGIVYKDMGKLLISNAAWFGNNLGTYEKLEGTFGSFEKLGGFSDVYGAAVGLDVSSNPTITGDSVLESVVFTGTLTTGKYVNGYTVGSYSGYNFNNNWSVRCTGIPTEGDAFATGFLYDSNNTLASRTTATTLNQGYKVVTNATATNNLLRVSSGTNGRLTYVGKKSRVFQVNASVSFVESSAGNNTNYLFYIAKIASNGTTVTALPATETFLDTNSGFVQAFPITGTVQLNTNESVEVYLKRITNPSSAKINIDVYSLNMAIK